MTRDEMLALAGACEKLEGPDREVDAAIAVATGKFFLAEPRYAGADRMYGYIDTDGSRVEPGNGDQHRLIPRYTASLDAAMTLLPTDGSITMCALELGWNQGDHAEWPAVTFRWYPPYKSGHEWHAHISSCRTLPLTIVHGALHVRARASLLSEKGEG